MTNIWCVVFKDIKTKEIFKFHPDQGITWEADCMAFMDTCSSLIMHNGIGYDFPLFYKVWNYNYRGKRVDTLLMSRLHSPDRARPKMMKGKAGPHSVEAWGHRFGRHKPEHEDWSQYSDEMLHRCTEDVEIQLLTFLFLQEEGGKEWYDAYRLTFKLFEILQKQEEYGWLVDKPHMLRCVAQLTKWIDNIDKVIIPKLPMVRIIEETKKDGRYNFVRKPFLKSGRKSAQAVKMVEDCGWASDCTYIAGPFSRVSFRTTNLDSGDEVKRFLLGAGWKPDKWNYKKDPVTKRPMRVNGQLERASPKLDKDDPFIGVEGKVGKLLAKRIQVRHRRSNIEGWLKLIRPDGRIGSRVNGIAATGRMKHSAIVNVPNGEAFYGKNMRRCFIAKEGYTLVSADAASCQDRMLADRAGVQEFTDMLLNGDKAIGTDGHSITASAVNSVLTRHRQPTITRGKGKGFGFGWKFGASDNKLGEMGGGRAELGLEIRIALEEAFPAQAALLERLTAEWRGNAKKRMNDWGKMELYNGWITGLDGRPIRISSEHQILVYMLQSDEAIYMSGVYCMLYHKLEKAGYVWGDDYGIVCFYHDEVTIECKNEVSEDIARLMEESFSQVSDMFKFKHCPQAGDAEIGANWYEIH